MKRAWIPRSTAPVLMTVMILAWATIVNAAEKGPDDGWHFAITPYIWLPDVDGSVRLDQPPGFEDGKIDTGPSDYLENLDFVGLLDLQVQRGRWIILADIIYLGFSDSETAQFPGALPGNGEWTAGADWNLQAVVFELAGAYSVFRNKNSTFDLLAGVRYTSLEGEVSLGITGTLPAWVSSQTFSKTESFVDPIIGFKGRFELNEKWYLPCYFDIGGFGVDSDLTLQAFAGIGYRFGDLFSTVLGYRYLYYDFDDDSKFFEDVKFYGATLSFSFTF